MHCEAQLIQPHDGSMLCLGWVELLNYRKCASDAATLLINRFNSELNKYYLYICFKCVIIVNASVKLKLTKINIIFKLLT